MSDTPYAKAKTELWNSQRTMLETVEDDLDQGSLDMAIEKWIDREHGISVDDKAQILREVSEEMLAEANALVEYGRTRSEPEANG